MKFVNLAKYADFDKISSARPAHFAYADRMRARRKLAIGGPLLDDQGRRIALLFIYEAVSKDEAFALAQEDPFTLANALSGCEISEWRLREVNVDLLIKASGSADRAGVKDTQIRLFANYAKYAVDESRLASVRPAHWEYDRTLASAGRLALAGPFTDDKGGLFVYSAIRKEEALSYLRRDPFALEGVFATYELLEWLIEGVNPDLLESDFSSGTTLRVGSTEPENKEDTMSTVQTANDIRPFHVDFAQAELSELRNRIAETRWPSPELVTDRSEGVQLATIKALARYWQTEYDWRKAEAKLNALPQFTTEIDGVDIHFIHVKSTHKNSLPLIMTHGWPGSVIEMIDSVGPLTDPTAYGGSAEDAFDLVLPSLPGYGFSAEPLELGWDLGRTARAWAELMRRLGYTRYVAQGGDVGAGVTDAMGRQAPEGLTGIHTNLLVPALNGPMPTNTDAERSAAAQIGTFRRSGNGYFVEMATRPQTIGYALLDSPIALAAWMIDHDTDAYYKIAHAFVDGQPSGNLSRDHILDNITLYWLSRTGRSAARSYWEAYGPDAPAASQQPLPPPVLPFGFTTFPGEIWRTPRSWVEASYPNVIYFHEVEKGGHFAAWEEPELFSAEVRAAFRSLRAS